MRVAGAGKKKKGEGSIGGSSGGGSATAGSAGGGSTAAGSAGGGRGAAGSAGGGSGAAGSAGGGSLVQEHFPVFSSDPACDLRTLIALASNASALILLTAARADLVTTF